MKKVPQDMMCVTLELLGDYQCKRQHSTER